MMSNELLKTIMERVESAGGAAYVYDGMQPVISYGALRQILAVSLHDTHPQPVTPADLHPATADLVTRFAVALGEKLLASQQKYGWDTHWQSPSWMDQCREQLVEHVAKGDPRDVAAYCAFLWHHGESTAIANPVTPAGGEVACYVVGAALNALRDIDMVNVNLRRYPGPECLALYTHPPVADAALVRDAERYRWIRDRYDPSVHGDDVLWLTAAAFDRDIDLMREADRYAALNQRGGGDHG